MTDYKIETLQDVYDDLVRTRMKNDVQPGDEVGAARVIKNAKITAPFLFEILQDLQIGKIP